MSTFAEDKEKIEQAGEAFVKDLSREIERVRRAGKKGRRANVSPNKLAKKYGLDTRGFMPLDYIVGMTTLGDLTLGGDKRDAQEVARKAIKAALNPVQVTQAPF